MHAPLGSGDIAQLVELRSCNWVVAITGWMSNCPGSNDSILYLKLRNKIIPLVMVQWSKHGREEATWEVEEKMRQNPLSEMRQKKRKENPWTDPIISTP
ncbi:hypothetical protein F511_16875 [Dorcoceras hygrometricum]|uniref:Chromo domain-containing protein n=1 Tax=Dorcoceras hygrometricum TaxID=472368 RepID=A0A2Z7BR00_9LAMI|nr:hypothetical protein F511_16875 [Dorcoceras hygrometricum]